jgi:cell division protein FtsI/penicillin-binding protein 2
MAYVSQDLKAKLAPAIKAVLKKYGVKGTIAVRNHMTLVLNIKSGALDFIGDFTKNLPDGNANKEYILRKQCIDVNPYHYETQFSGKAKEFLKEIMPLMNNGNWDKSDIQSDYFNVGWYVDVNIGQWDKPYTVVASK